VNVSRRACLLATLLLSACAKDQTMSIDFTAPTTAIQELCRLIPGTGDKISLAQQLGTATPNIDVLDVQPPPGLTSLTVGSTGRHLWTELTYQQDQQPTVAELETAFGTHRQMPPDNDDFHSIARFNVPVKGGDCVVLAYTNDMFPTIPPTATVVSITVRYDPL
jgi:hypothetical protein